MAGDGDGLAMLNVLVESIPTGSNWRNRLDEALADPSVGVHLAIFVEPFLEAVLDGRKTVESRFSRNKAAPFRRVSAGDVIVLKRAGGPVVGVAIAGGASYHELDEDSLRSIRKRFARQICAVDDEFWTQRAHKRFASLINIDATVTIATMPWPKRDRRGWVTYRTGRPVIGASD